MLGANYKKDEKRGYDPAVIGPPGSREYVFAELRKRRKVMQDSPLKVN